MFTSKTPTKRRRIGRAASVRGRLQFEQLEARTMFDGNGLLLSNDAYLTLSFATDGTNVAGQPSALAAKFNAIAPQSVWQNAILQAFQTWATRTNADVGIGADGGQPFGTPGPTRGDARFGDIRIGAVAMDPLVGGESTPVDQLVGGTWQADVVFNTNFNFHTVSDIYEIALHEAGHVFGLEDNNDPNSPLHGGTIPTATVPNAQDTLNLQALYGSRLPDFAEQDGNGGAANNNSMSTATTLVVAGAPDVVPGSVPVLVYGDITTASDLDYYRLKVPDTYTGPVTIDVRSSGLSLLTPHLQIYSESQQLLQDITSTSKRGDTLSYTIPSASPNDIYYIGVSGSASDDFGRGGYVVKATFNGVPQADLSILSSYTDANLRKLSQDEIRTLIVPSTDHFLNEDAHVDDNLANAIPLQSKTDFTDPSRFEVVGSISDATDTDFYRVRSPQNVAAPANVLTVSIRTLSAGHLVPSVRAFDRNLVELPVTILANGAGELVVQVDNVESNRNYYLEVAADDPAGPFNKGNYQLSASFRDQPANFQTFASGILTSSNTQKVHTLYVAQPQLFHFLLQAGTVPGSAPAAVVTTIYNQAGDVVYQLSSSAGNTQSQGAVLLGIGTYTVRVAALTFAGSVPGPISYTLSGEAISDPFASDPSDQTTNPFTNPDPTSGGSYLYPGSIPSNDPFLWDSFIQSLSYTPPSDVRAQVQLLIGSWWSWFWGQTGANGPPLGQADYYAASASSVLTVSAAAGVLGNDIEPESDPMAAALIAGPPVGVLDFHSDGSFQYTPSAGFNGTVQFSYQATDFQQMSNTASVSIAVGLIGDYDHNGIVGDHDYDVWRANLGSTQQLDADGNGNGTVDLADYVLWRKNLGASAAAATGSGLSVAATGASVASSTAAIQIATSVNNSPASLLQSTTTTAQTAPRAGHLRTELAANGHATPVHSDLLNLAGIRHLKSLGTRRAMNSAAVDSAFADLQLNADTSRLDGPMSNVMRGYKGNYSRRAL